MKFLNNKKGNIIVKSLIFIVLFLIFSTAGFAGSTPTFTAHVAKDSFTVSDNSITQTIFHLKNFDSTRWEILQMYGFVNNRREAMDNWLFFEENYVLLAPGEERPLDYIIHVPAGVCQDTYEITVVAKLVSYDDSPSLNTPISFSTAIGDRVSVIVNSGIPCGGPIPGLDSPITPAQRLVIYNLLGKDPSEPIPPMIQYALKLMVSAMGRLVYYDSYGEGLYIDTSMDKLIPMGTAKIYNSSDTLLLTTDLSATGAVYNVPGGTFVGPQDFYINVETGKFDSVDPTKLDRTWEGNLYVDRAGTYAVPDNAFFYRNISHFWQMVNNIDIRSRNTDHQGDWASGTISIGPDDKDEVVSPVRWDYEVATENFKYADLDHSGRIGPDDKDHIISPLYWDFPN